MNSDRLKSSAEYFKQHRKTAAVIAGFALGFVIWVLTTVLSSPYTVVNAGAGKVYKVNRRTGQSWLLTGSREVPVTRTSEIPDSGGAIAHGAPRTSADIQRDTAIQKAKGSYVLGRALPSFRGRVIDNEGVVREILESDYQAEIKGWKAQQIDHDTYLICCTYSDASSTERGFCFEVKLNTGTVRNVFLNTGLYSRYERYGINPAYLIESDGLTPVPAWLDEQSDPIDRDEKATARNLPQEAEPKWFDGGVNNSGDKRAAPNAEKK